jgi:hypothetical protein
LALVWFFVQTVLWSPALLRCSAYSEKLLWLVLTVSGLCICSLITSVAVRIRCESNQSEDSAALELALLEGADTSTSNPNSAAVSSSSRLVMCVRGIFAYGMVVAVLLALALGAAALVVRMEVRHFPRVFFNALMCFLGELECRGTY